MGWLIGARPYEPILQEAWEGVTIESMDFQPDCQISIPSHVLHRDLGSETVLLDLDNGVYYGLDAVATRLWSALVETPRLGDVYQTLSDEYEVPSDRLWADLTNFLSELREKGLIDVRLEQTA